MTRRIADVPRPRTAVNVRWIASTMLVLEGVIRLQQLWYWYADYHPTRHTTKLEPFVGLGGDAKVWRDRKRQRMAQDMVLA
jgi:hypothetical protein